MNKTSSKKQSKTIWKLLKLGKRSLQILASNIQIELRKFFQT